MKLLNTSYRTSIILLLAVSFASAEAQRILPYYNGTTGGQGVAAMVEYNGQLVMGGSFSSFNGHGRMNLQGWDGTTYFDYPGAFDAVGTKIASLIVFNGDLIAAGTDPNFGNVAGWDGSGWLHLGSGPSTNRVVDMCVFNGELYVTTFLDKDVRRWDGTDWVVVGEMFSSAVNALAVYNGELYAAGNFTHNTSVPDLRRLAKWNGTGWEEVNNGLSGNVNDLMTTPDGLVICGIFLNRGDGQQSFPKWTVYDGNAFSEPASGVGPMGSAEVKYISRVGDAGYLLGGYSAPSLLVSENGYRELAFRSTGCGLSYDGNDLLGVIGMDTSLVAVRGVGRLLDGTYQAWLDAGNVKAAVTPGSEMFRDKLRNIAGFEAPKRSGTHSIFSITPWIIGERSGATIYDMETYSSNETPSYGPHATTMDGDYMDRYLQVWKLDKTTISEHAQHWEDADYVAPYMIVNWPGNGDISNGEPAQLAPYADLNANGIYEPQAGEYPLIRGDQATYSLIHSFTGLDLGVMHYAYADSTDVDRYNTVFTNLTIVNRGQEALHNARFGMFTDFDLGGASDDLIGCDSLLGLSFVYNGGNLDLGATGQLGYGTNIPSQGVLFLNQPMTAHAFTDPYAGDQLSAINGNMNGMPFTQTGYASHFQYPGGLFTDEAAGNTPGERRSVSSIGPLTIEAGDTLCVDMAFPFARAASGDRLESIAALKVRAQALRDRYDAQGVACNVVPDLITRVAASAPLQFNVFPIPASDRVTIACSMMQGKATLQLLDATGRIVRAMAWPTGSDQVVLDLNGIRNGSYFISLGDAGMRSTQPLVVLR